MRSPHTWPLPPFLFFPNSAPWRSSCKDGGSSALRVIFPGSGAGSGWALRLLPQPHKADPLLYRLSGGGQSCPQAFSERPGRSREEQGECSALLDTSSPPLGCREDLVGSRNPRSSAGGSEGCNCLCLCAPEAVGLLVLYTNRVGHTCTCLGAECIGK